MYNLTQDMSTLGFFSTANSIANNGLFMIITLIIFMVILFYTMARADIGRAVSIASFISIMISIFFVAMNLMNASILLLFTVTLIGGILLATKSSGGMI